MRDPLAAALPIRVLISQDRSVKKGTVLGRLGQAAALAERVFDVRGIVIYRIWWVGLGIATGLWGAIGTVSVSAATLTATANDSDSFTPIVSELLINGDFAIQPSPGLSNTLLGDGADEITSWTFDFTSDPDFPTFPTAEPLTSALLTLDLTPGEANVSSDFLGIPELGIGFGTAVLQTLSVGVTSRVTFDLLEVYTSSELLGVLTAGSGQINFGYQDDAFISFAQLELFSATAVPEPLTIVGSLVAAGAGIVLKRRKPVA